jgi:hypothetical protein
MLWRHNLTNVRQASILSWSTKPPADWLQQFWQASGPLLRQFTPQNLSNTLYACGKLSTKPPADWLQQFWQASGPLLRQFTPQNLSNTLHACALLGEVPPDDWLRRFWQASADQLAHFNPQGLSNTLYACGKLSTKPPADWLQQFWQVSGPLLAHFKPQGLSNTLYACGKLSTKPPDDWLRRFWQASAAKLGEFNTQALCNTLYGLAVLELWDSPLMQELWQQLQIRALAPRLGAALLDADERLDLLQLYQVHQVAAVERPGMLTVSDPALLETARVARREDRSRDKRTSAFQKSVSECLSVMDVAHDLEHWCKRSEHSIDIAIVTDALRIALEVDGPFHFLDNGQPNGPTRLRDWFLTAHGWRVVVVPYHEWDALGTQQERAAYLTRLLASAAQS